MVFFQTKGQLIEMQEKPMFQFKNESRKKVSVPVQRQSGRKDSLTWGRVSLFVLFRLSVDCVKFIHIEGNLLYSDFQFKCFKLTQNIFTETSNTVFD